MAEYSCLHRQCWNLAEIWKQPIFLGRSFTLKNVHLLYLIISI